MYKERLESMIKNIACPHNDLRGVFCPQCIKIFLSIGREYKPEIERAEKQITASNEAMNKIDLSMADTTWIPPKYRKKEDDNKSEAEEMQDAAAGIDVTTYNPPFSDSRYNANGFSRLDGFKGFKVFKKDGKEKKEEASEEIKSPFKNNMEFGKAMVDVSHAIDKFNQGLTESIKQSKAKFGAAINWKDSSIVSEKPNLENPKFPCKQQSSAAKAVGNLYKAIDLRANRKATADMYVSLGLKPPAITDEYLKNFNEDNTAAGIGENKGMPISSFCGFQKMEAVHEYRKLFPEWNPFNNTAEHVNKISAEHATVLYVLSNWFVKFIDIRGKDKL